MGSSPLDVSWLAAGMLREDSRELTSVFLPVCWPSCRHSAQSQHGPADGHDAAEDRNARLSPSWPVDAAGSLESMQRETVSAPCMGHAHVVRAELRRPGVPGAERKGLLDS